MSVLSPVAPLPMKWEHSHPSLLSTFIDWCDGQQENRLLWLGIALVGQSAVLAPLTVSLVLITGAGFGWLMVALAAITIAVVTNLAALPTKITIPALALSVLTDLSVVLMCLFTL